MKLLVLSSRFPLPLEKGDKLRLYHQVKYLSQHHDIILVSLADEPFEQKLLREMRPFCKEIYVLPHRKRSNVFFAILGLMRRLPLNVGYFCHKDSLEKVDAIIEKTKPDAIYVQLIRMAPYVRKVHNIPLWIDYMDAFSLRLTRRADKSGWLLSMLWKLESHMLQAYEKLVSPSFDGRFIISESDGAYLQEKGVGSLELLLNGVDTEYFDRRGDQKPEYDIVFVGNMSYHPNILAAHYLIEKVAIPLKKVLPGLRVLIAGATPAPSLEKINLDWITVSGYVDDIRDAYAAGKVFVAPIFAGSGMQNKILEAMAMGLPCVTSSQVARAIGAPDDVVYQADEDLLFIEVVKMLLTSHQLRGDVGVQARQFVVENYDWETCCKPLEKLNGL